MTYDGNSGGVGPGEQSDAHSGEDQGNVRSYDNEDTRSSKLSKPSFDPSQLSEFADTGFEFIKLHGPKDTGKNGKPLGKAPIGHWRRPEAAICVDEAIDHMEGNRNIGVRLGQLDLIVDVDPRNFIDGKNSFEALGKKLGIEWQEWPCVITGSGGFHYYMRKPADVRIRTTLDGYPGVEFKTDGSQVVAPGSVHPDTLNTYLWDPLSDPLKQRQEAPVQLIEMLTRPDADLDADNSGEHSSEQLENMLKGLNVEDFCENDKWLPIMMACHHATDGNGVEEFLTWSTGDPKYANDDWIIRNRWDSLDNDKKRKKVTVKSLYQALHKAGNGHLIPNSIDCDEFADDLDFQNEGSSFSPTAALEKVNSEHFTVLTGGKYLVGREKPCPFSGFMKVEWYPDEAIRKHLDNRSVVLTGSNGDEKPKPMGSWWIKHPGRRQYEGVIFDPNPSANHIDLYNLWRGWSVEPKEGDWSLMKQLVKDVLCGGNQESYDYVLKWCAFMVQYPNMAAEVALVFKGTKGVGKGTFVRALMDLAGLHGLQVAQAEHFTGRFNEHLADKIFLFVDEGMWGGDKKLEGAIKNLITEPTLTFEGKNKPIVSGPNRLHIMIASNEDWVVPASNDERRFAIFEADQTEHAGLPDNFFGMIHGQMSSGGQAAMLHELMNTDLGNWHPRQNVPVTAALVDQKLEGLRSDPIAFWWYRKLEDGTLDCLKFSDSWIEDAILIGSLDKEALICDLCSEARSMGKRAEFTKAKLARSLSEFGIDVKARDSKGGRCWSFPPLQDARASFEAWLGGKIRWDSDG